MSDSLRSRMIRAAYNNPELRSDLLPIITAYSSRTDAQWAAEELDEALDRLKDVVDVLTARGPGTDFEANTSLADDNRDAAETVRLLQKLSEMPAKLRRIR